jgi:hypothetical protein
MQYNVIPHFVPLNPSLYLAYPTRTKGLDPMMFRKYIGYVRRYVYLFLNNLYRQHIHHILLGINFLQWFNW